MSQRLDAEALREVLGAACKRRGVPGAVFGLWRDGKLDIAVHGVLNVETGEAVRPDSMFQIGSVTKVLTATLVMMLAEEGRLELDAPVRAYLPSFRTGDLAATKRITVRQLLNHTNGLAGDFFTDTGSGGDRLARFLDSCALLPQAHLPGEGFSYSNVGFGVAGRLIEVLTGRDFDAVLKERLFKPLALEAAFSEPPDLVGRSVASGHSPKPGQPMQSIRVPTLYTLPMSGSAAGATTVMSAENLIRFARMHLADGEGVNGARILKPETARAMQAPSAVVPVPARDITGWGLGWFLLGAGEDAFFGHDGGTIGQYSFLRVHEPSGTIAVLYANGGAYTDLMFDVFGTALDPLIGFRPTPAPSPAAHEGDLDRYAGVYRTVAGDTTITRDGGKLIRTANMRIDDAMTEEPAAALTPAGADTFILTRPPNSYPTTFSFLHPDGAGRPQVLFSGLRVANRVT